MKTNIWDKVHAWNAVEKLLFKEAVTILEDYSHNSYVTHFETRPILHILGFNVTSVIFKKMKWKNCFEICPILCSYI